MWASLARHVRAAFFGSRTFLALAILVLIGAIGAWFYFVGFPDGATGFAHFGTYVGGIGTPFAILAGLLTLVQRDREHRIELERLQKQGHKIDIHRFIEKIDAEIESTLGQLTLTVVSGGQQVSHPCRDALCKIAFPEWEKVIPTEAEIRDRSRGGLDRFDRRLILFETFGMVAAYINRLRDHCEEYDRAAGNNVTGLNYARKYRLASERLRAKGYDVAVWMPGARNEAQAN